VQGSGSQPKFARRVCGGSPQNRSGYLVEPQNQDRRLSRRRRAPGSSRSFDFGDHMAGSQGLRREDAGCGEGMAVHEEKYYMTYLPLRGLYLNLCNRGSFVFQLPPYKHRGERMAAIS
jgi:hypothetical protein